MSSQTKGISKKAGLLIVITLLLILSGQFFSKTGVLYLEGGNMIYGYVAIGMGYLSLFTRGFVWIYLLKLLDLSLAYPLQSLSYVIIMLLGIFAFNEQVGIQQWIGCVFIILGSLIIIKKK